LSYGRSSDCLISANPLAVQSCDTRCGAQWAIFKEDNMGKYVLAWILGVPAFVLVLIYIFAH